MTRYSKPVWQMVREALEELGDLNGPTTIRHIQDHYPQEDVNRNTIQLQLIACSVNHPSARQFDDPNRFLWYEGNGHYRAYDPDTDHAEIQVGWRIAPVTRRTPRETIIDEVPFSRVEVGNRVVLPVPIAQGLDIGPNDIVAFVEEEGRFYIRKGRLRIEVD